MDQLTKYGLRSFTGAMFKVLEDNYTTKRDSWVTSDISFLRNKLKEEVNEYLTAATDIERMKEAIDIANICLFIYVRCMLASSQARFEEYLKTL